MTDFTLFEWVAIVTLWLPTTIFLHELGHYVGFRGFGIRPRIKPRWWGVEIGQLKDVVSLRPFGFYIVGASGVASGLVFTMFFHNNLLMVAYLVMCALDFFNMYHALRAGRQKFTNFGSYIHKENTDRLAEIEALRGVWLGWQKL